MLLEELCQYYRMFVPIPVWFRYLIAYGELDTALGCTLGILLGLLYLILKVWKLYTLLKLYINFWSDCSAGIITGGLRTQHISEYSPLNSLATWCFSFTDAAFQENCLRTQNHLFVALNWDCKAKDTATIAPLTSDTDQTISRYWGKELAKIKIKLTAKRITIFQETKLSLLEYSVWC